MVKRSHPGQYNQLCIELQPPILKHNLTFTEL